MIALAGAALCAIVAIGVVGSLAFILLDDEDW